MSYDLELVSPNTGEILQVDEKHHIRGGTFVVGGTTRLELNVTYNYAPYFYRVLGESGIREIYGRTGEESIPILEKAIEMLGDDVSRDYWEPTEGNARQVLIALVELAKMAPHGEWRGD